MNFKRIFLIILITLSLSNSVLTVCNQINCPPTHGECNGNICICKEEYTTINNQKIKNNGIFCNYPLKSRLIAFLLEFFFPFGVGHFYSGNIFLAIIKLALFILLISMCCSILCCAAGKILSICSTIICAIVVLSLIALVFMEIFDLVGYGLGIYKDGNGVLMG